MYALSFRSSDLSDPMDTDRTGSWFSNCNRPSFWYRLATILCRVPIVIGCTDVKTTAPLPRLYLNSTNLKVKFKKYRDRWMACCIRYCILVTNKCKNYLLTIAIDMKSPDPSGCCWSYNRIPSSEKLLNSISKLNLWYAFNFFNWTYECPLNAAGLCSENVGTYWAFYIVLNTFSVLRFTFDFLQIGTNGATVGGWAMALETAGMQSLAFPSVLTRIRVTEWHFPICRFRCRSPGQVLDLRYDIDFVTTGRVVSEIRQFGK